MTKVDKKHFAGFSKLNIEERFKRLEAIEALSAKDINFLKNGGVKDVSLAEHFIENVIGYFQLPLGVACYFNIDGKDKIIPLAVEETSIIAALSKSAKWISNKGHIKTETIGNTVIGQIQIAVVNDTDKLKKTLEQNKHFLIEIANQEVAQGLVKRGGGVKDLSLRLLERPDGKTMGVIHVNMDCCDAMGANIINQTLEYLKPKIENLTNETVNICILSNLSDSKLSKATVTLNDVDEDLGKGIEEASIFAETCPYRATTHNKGVLNGIDPILIATGNDWRAVEAGIHAFCSQSGSYKPITTWRYNKIDKVLTGTFLAPIAVGIVGGVTALHPTAKLCLSMLDVKSADELARIIAAVGLVQNLGAIKALSTEGIIQGHMRLHIDNLMLSAGATADEKKPLKAKLEAWLHENKRISLDNAKALLKAIRQKSQVA